MEGFNRAVTPSTPCRFITAFSPGVRVNATGLKIVRYGCGLCLVCWTSVFVLGLIGVSVVLVFLRSVRGDHHVKCEVTYSLNNLGRVLSFFLVVCLCVSFCGYVVEFVLC